MGAVARIGSVALLAALAIAIVVILWILLGRTPEERVFRGGIAGPLTLEQFKIGIGCVESDGDYEAVNGTTSAIGKYQILPRNWPVWAGRFLDDRHAEPTPANQEQVATKRFNELRRTFDGNWARVAYWWLTGGEDPDKSTWSDFATGYVNGVMAYARAAQTLEGRATVPVSCFSTPDDPHPAVRPSWAPKPVRPRPSPAEPTPPPLKSVP